MPTNAREYGRFSNCILGKFDWERFLTVAADDWMHANEIYFDDQENGQGRKEDILLEWNYSLSTNSRYLQGR